MSLLDELWAGYAAQVPYARTFVELSKGSFRNDHVAFRSLDLAPVARLFEGLGWQRKGVYDFPDAHLNAIHLSKPGEPRVFVSELRVQDLSPRARELLARLPEAEPARADPSWFVAPEPRFHASELLELERESQYAAWLCLFGREVNHFTAAVDDVEAVAARLREATADRHHRGPAPRPHARRRARDRRRASRARRAAAGLRRLRDRAGPAALRDDEAVSLTTRALRLRPDGEALSLRPRSRSC
jgi:hypothetical protein